MASPQEQQQQPVTQQPGGTTVIINQEVKGSNIRVWRTGLFGCFDDCMVCLYVSFCCTCAAYSLVSRMGESICLPCCMPNFMIPLRTKLRTQLGIQGSICSDCIVTSCCPQCAMCQLMREHKWARQSGEL